MSKIFKKKKIKVFINGLGRIGRNCFRQIFEEGNSHLEIVGLNDPDISLKNFLYLINYDSTYGKFKIDLKYTKNLIKFNLRTIRYHQTRSISKFKNFDIFIDCSGVGKKSHLDQLNILKQKKFVVVTNDMNNFQSVVWGINSKKLPRNKGIFTSSICDAVAAAPIIKFFKKFYTIKSGFITTLHPVLSYQNLLDNKEKKDQKDSFILGRSSINSLIPKDTSVVFSLNKLFNNIDKKFDCQSIRVPTTIVSCGIMTINLDKNINLKKLLYNFKLFVKKEPNLIKLIYQPLTSIDFLNNRYPTNISVNLIKKIDTNSLNLVYWYDNEAGYVSNLLNNIKKLKF